MPFGVRPFVETLFKHQETAAAPDATKMAVSEAGTRSNAASSSTDDKTKKQDGGGAPNKPKQVGRAQHAATMS